MSAGMPNKQGTREPLSEVLAVPLKVLKAFEHNSDCNAFGGSLDFSDGLVARASNNCAKRMLGYIINYNL